MCIGRPVGVDWCGEESLDGVECRLARAVEFLALDNPCARDKLSFGFGVGIQIEVATKPLVTHRELCGKTRFADTLTTFQNQHRIELNAGLFDPPHAANQEPRAELPVEFGIFSLAIVMQPCIETRDAVPFQSDRKSVV